MKGTGFSPSVVGSKIYPALEHFRFCYRLPCPIHFRVFCGNGWDTNEIQVYTIPQNALTGVLLSQVSKSSPRSLLQKSEGALI